MPLFIRFLFYKIIFNGDIDLHQDDFYDFQLLTQKFQTSINNVGEKNIGANLLIELISRWHNFYHYIYQYSILTMKNWV